MILNFQLLLSLTSLSWNEDSPEDNRERGIPIRKYQFATELIEINTT
jgi:hypothetical protein